MTSQKRNESIADGFIKELFSESEGILKSFEDMQATIENDEHKDDTPPGGILIFSPKKIGIIGWATASWTSMGLMIGAITAPITGFVVYHWPAFVILHNNIRYGIQQCN